MTGRTENTLLWQRSRSLHPPASPKHTIGIPSGAAIKEGKGIVSPTTPLHGKIQWPVRQISRGKSETRGGKIPENKEVRFANVFVRRATEPPA